MRTPSLPSTPLRALIVEDSEDDVLLLVRALRRGGYDLAFERVETASAMRAALDQQTWDIVISDYSMPHFGGLAALALMKEIGPDLPFIILSGVIGEETAVEVMRAGAHDYIMKGNLARLIPAIRRELQDAEVRRARKLAEEALRASEEKYRTILESIQDGYFEMDNEGNLTFFNDSLCTITGYSRDEMMGANNRQHVDKENAKKVFRTFNLAHITGEPVEGFDWKITRKDGTQRWLEASVSPIANSGGEPVGVRGMVRDITERKIMEMQLAQAQKLEAIGQLAAGIAHEINTPIQYVGDNTRFLQDCFTDIAGVLEEYDSLLQATKAGSVPAELIAAVENSIDETDVEYLSEEIPVAIEQSLEGIARVVKIVGAMRTFSHSSTEEKKATDINTSIESTITVARSEWKYVAEMETDFDTDLPQVPCLVGEFNQVILNLLVNAAHAIADVVGSGSGAMGMITVSTRRDGDWVEIRVSDTGTGIPEAVRPRIFEPFFTTKDVGKGTGQGLAIAYNVVVEKHAGTITLETEVGKGTTFIVRLPISHAPQVETEAG